MDRFELEQAIIACGNIVDDIDVLLDAMVEDSIDRERLANALVGLREVHEMRCKKAFDIFSAMVQIGAIA